MDTPPGVAMSAAPSAHVETAPASEIHYGGPDQPPRALRNVLQTRIEAAPPGSEIVWSTYYFRDRQLADALVAAQKRGVQVRVILDARPRRSGANTEVIERLRAGLGDGLRVYRSFIPGARLHAKIYAFSGPEPVAFIGSFNPSGDDPEDPDVVAEIGDQDRGHNLLVQFREPQVVDAVRAQVGRLWAETGVSRFSAGQNRPVRLETTTLYYFPRLNPAGVGRSVRKLGPGDVVQAAISHLSSGLLTRALAQAAKRGARVELIVHDTERRVSNGVVADLVRAGVSIRRYCHPERLPMHAKFVIVDQAGRSMAWFGSLNYNFSSRYLNQEILAQSTEPRLISSLKARFTVIAAEADRFPRGHDGSCGPRPADLIPSPAPRRVTVSGTSH